MAQIERYLSASDSPIRDVVACLDRNAKGIVLVVDDERHLVGTVTDGDIRRVILAGIDLSVPVTELLERKSASPYPYPITARQGTGRIELLRLMQQHAIRHVPLLDDDGRVAALAVLEDLVPEENLPVTAVVMAGGYGRRLQPVTDDTPKPMLHVGGRSIIEWIIEGLEQAGVRRVIVTTHYKPEAITQHIGDGRSLGVQIEYLHEEEPAGTAGCLSLIPRRQEPLLVINGDILTRVDFRALLHYHRDHEADMTVALREYSVQVPYGTVELEDVRILGLDEKPSLQFFVNAGIYLLEPSVQSYVAEGERVDMTDVIGRLLDDGRAVVGFPVREYWIDIGQHADYEQAQEDMRNWRSKG